jgi:hypothetical protein
MGSQLIFVVETNKACKSDWIYIKETIEQFFTFEKTQVKLSTVYMGGKGNYNSKKVEKEIKNLITQYSVTGKNNRSSVIYCVDCDDYNNNPDDAKFLESVGKYCDSKGYDFVWFCKDVEQVYKGKKVDDSQKKETAIEFKIKKEIRNIDTKRLCMDTYQINTSNIIRVFDKYQELIRK